MIALRDVGNVIGLSTSGLPAHMLVEREHQLNDGEWATTRTALVDPVRRGSE